MERAVLEGRVIVGPRVLREAEPVRGGFSRKAVFHSREREGDADSHGAPFGGCAGGFLDVDGRGMLPEALNIPYCNSIA